MFKGKVLEKKKGGGLGQITRKVAARIGKVAVLTVIFATVGFRLFIL